MFNKQFPVQEISHMLEKQILSDFSFFFSLSTGALLEIPIWYD